MLSLFSNKFLQALWILCFFAIFIVLPGLKEGEIGFEIPKALKQANLMQYGIIHLNSLFFIGLSTIVLWMSISRDYRAANKNYSDRSKSFIDAERYFENYFDGKIKLGELVERIKTNPMIGKIFSIVRVGGAEDDLALGIQKVSLDIEASYIKLKNDYEYIATILPILGMIGTIAGLLEMFAVPTEVEDFSNKFAGLSVALATTLYASLFTVLIFKPKARSVEEWLVDLDKERESLEIAAKKFYHKVDLGKLEELVAKDGNEG